MPELTDAQLAAAVAVEVMGYKWVRAKPCEWFTEHPIGKGSCAANRMRQGLAWLESPDQLAVPEFAFRRVLADASGKNVCNTEYVTIAGESPHWGCPKPYPTDIAAAWEVHRKMHERLYSVRQRYYLEIQRAVQQRTKMAGLPAWPDVFGLIEPADICHAALAAVRKDSNTRAEEG